MQILLSVHLLRLPAWVININKQGQQLHDLRVKLEQKQAFQCQRTVWKARSALISQAGGGVRVLVLWLIWK